MRDTVILTETAAMRVPRFYEASIQTYRTRLSFIGGGTSGPGSSKRGYRWNLKACDFLAQCAFACHRLADRAIDINAHTTVAISDENDSTG